MADKDLKIIQGKTFSDVVRWQTEPLIFKPITAISLASGAPRLTVPAHAVPPGLKVAVSRVIGMRKINAKNSPPDASDYVESTTISSDIIELNGVSPFDDNGREWPAYESGGFIQYYTPVDLTGFKARWVFRRSFKERFLLKCVTAGTSGASLPASAGIDGSVVWEETTEQSKKKWAPGIAFSLGDVVDTKALFMFTETDGVELDNTNKKIIRTISAVNTASMTLRRYEYELELESLTGEVFRIDAGVADVALEGAP